MLLIVVLTMLWVSQAYAACCGPHGGTHHQSMNAVIEMNAIVQSEHEGCSDPQEPCCTQMVDEKLPIASVQLGIVDDGRLAQPALLQHAPPMLFEPPRAGNDRIPDSPGPPDRVYLRLQRFLI
jgi:hypothetical protein